MSFGLSMCLKVQSLDRSLLLFFIYLLSLLLFSFLAKHAFRVFTKDWSHGKSLVLQANDQHDKKQWLNSFEKVLKGQNRTNDSTELVDQDQNGANDSTELVGRDDHLNVEMFKTPAAVGVA